VAKTGELSGQCSADLALYGTVANHFLGGSLAWLLTKVSSVSKVRVCLVHAQVAIASFFGLPAQKKTTVLLRS